MLSWTFGVLLTTCVPEWHHVCPELPPPPPLILYVPVPVYIQSPPPPPEVLGTTLSSNGRYRATLDASGAVVVRDLHLQRDVRRFQASPTGKKEGFVRFSPSGQHLAIPGEKNTVQVLDVQSGRLERSLGGHTRPVTDVKFVDDNTILTRGADRTVNVTDRQTGERIETYKASSSRDVALSSRKGIHYDRKGLAVVEKEGEKEGAAYEGHQSSPTAWAESPDGSRLATADEGHVRIFSTQTKKVINQWPLAVPPDSIEKLAFTPDGNYLIEAGASILHYRSLKDGKTERRIEVSGDVKSLLVRLAAGTLDPVVEVGAGATIEAFNLRTGDPYSGPYAPLPARKPGTDSVGERARSARLIIERPAGSRLFIDDVHVPLAQETVNIHTPSLAPGRKYFYTVRCVPGRGRRGEPQTQRVIVTAGETSRVFFKDAPVLSVDAVKGQGGR